LVPVDLDPSNECVRVVMMAFVKGTEPAVGCGPRRQGVPGSSSDPPAPAPTPLPSMPSRPQASAPGESDNPAHQLALPGRGPGESDALAHDVRGPAFAAPALTPTGQGP